MTSHRAKRIWRKTKIGALRIGPAPFSLEHTLTSGQTFRWREEGKGFVGVVSGILLRLEQSGKRVFYQSIPGRASPHALRSYLGLDAPFEQSLCRLQRDPVLQLAMQTFPGMRILRQDPWETLVSFIISSNNNIPRIKKCIESLCQTFGKAIAGAPGFYSFPTPEALADASPTCLRQICNLGYRHAYVKEAARKTARDPNLLSHLAILPYPEARKTLIAEFPGVGPKVADCVLLYSMGKYEAFPVDTWIRKMVENLYFHGVSLRPPAIKAFAEKRFGPFAGHAQLYLFQYALSAASRKKKRLEGLDGQNVKG